MFQPCISSNYQYSLRITCCKTLFFCCNRSLQKFASLWWIYLQFKICNYNYYIIISDLFVLLLITEVCLWFVWTCKYFRYAWHFLSNFWYSFFTSSCLGSVMILWLRRSHGVFVAVECFGNVVLWCLMLAGDLLGFVVSCLVCFCIGLNTITIMTEMNEQWYNDDNMWLSYVNGTCC